LLYDCFKAGKLRRMKHEQDSSSPNATTIAAANEGLGVNLQTGVVMICMILLMLFAVHCTWVTANAYSSPSIVLAFYTNDGLVSIFIYCIYYFIYEFIFVMQTKG